MTNDELLVLGAALRNRPATLESFAEVTGLSPEAAAQHIAEFAASGFLRVAGDTIDYLPPDDPISRALGRVLERQQSIIAETTQEARHLARMIPRLLGEWSHGELFGSDVVHADVIHSPESLEQVWYQQAKRGARESFDAVLPDLGTFRLPTEKSRNYFFTATRADGWGSRVIMSLKDGNDPIYAEGLIRHTVENGVAVRLHPNPPSWFWVGGTSCGMPLEWGQAWPENALAVRSPAIAGMMQATFDALWSQSSPVGETDDTWTPLLRLMKQGATLDMASRAVGVVPRTGRRRIAAAMEHYGTETLFGLGVAWAERGESRD